MLRTKISAKSVLYFSFSKLLQVLLVNYLLLLPATLVWPEFPLNVNFRDLGDYRYIKVYVYYIYKFVYNKNSSLQAVINN